MIHQTSFSQAEFAGKKKGIWREKFLARMEEAIPWARLLAVIEPHYPKGGRGRPPVGLERMLRVYFLQQWYGLADQAHADAGWPKPWPKARRKRPSRRWRKRRRRCVHPFDIVKNIFGHRKARHRGLARNGHQLYTLFGLANVLIGGRTVTT